MFAMMWEMLKEAAEESGGADGNSDEEILRGTKLKIC